MKIAGIALLAISFMAQAQMPYKNFRSPVPDRETDYYASTNARGGVKLTIAAKFKPEFTCYPYPDMRTCEDVYHREYEGVLEQHDGKIVVFDPTNPADKIIDRDLISWVEWCSAEVMREDAAYIKTSIEFTDASGQHWQKVGAK